MTSFIMLLPNTWYNILMRIDHDADTNTVWLNDMPAPRPSKPISSPTMW